MKRFNPSKIELKPPVMFTIDNCKAMVLVLFVLCVTLWLLATRLFFMLCAVRSLVKCILSSIVIILLRTKELVALLSI